MPGSIKFQKESWSKYDGAAHREVCKDISALTKLWGKTFPEASKNVDHFLPDWDVGVENMGMGRKLEILAYGEGLDLARIKQLLEETRLVYVRTR